MSGLEVRGNLEVQTAVVAGVCALYCTYGGFSDLGVLAGVNTVAFCSQRSFNPVHLTNLGAVLRDLGRASSFEIVDLSDAETAQSLALLAAGTDA